LRAPAGPDFRFDPHYCSDNYGNFYVSQLGQAGPVFRLDPEMEVKPKHRPAGVCVKRPPAPPAAGGLVNGGWGPKVGSPAFLCPDHSRPPANIAACNFLTRNRLIPISTQANFNRVGLYRLNSASRNHRPNRVMQTIHWLPVWPKCVIAWVSLISVVTQLNFNRVGLYENKRRCRLGYRGYYKGPT